MSAVTALLLSALTFGGPTASRAQGPSGGPIGILLAAGDIRDRGAGRGERCALVCGRHRRCEAVFDLYQASAKRTLREHERGIPETQLYRDGYNWSFVAVDGPAVELPVVEENCNRKPPG